MLTTHDNFKTFVQHFVLRANVIFNRVKYFHADNTGNKTVNYINIHDS